MTLNIKRFIPVVLLALTFCKQKEAAPEALNQLANAYSPYLREHADNPVNWYEWGDEALTKAKQENKPLIISIGYASCHWCHVMERESFMDTAVARIMNENFVSIKIDREERPDIDQVYINAAQLISGTAGWPLNAFALPDGKPFYAATYFPKEEWIKILRQVSELYRKENYNVTKQAAELTRAIQSFDKINDPVASKQKFDQKAYANIFNLWLADLDEELGGLQGAPKFPMPVNWEFLLQYHHLTGNKKALDVVMRTLDQMAKGGIYDQLGGGFSRYTTDSQWRIPHFEKMLYDNGQLVSLYAHAYQVAGSPLYRRIIDETLGFVEREMISPEGGFYASINADSEGEEGKYYIWTKAEIEQVLDAGTSRLLVGFYQLSDTGNWENNKNILYTKRSHDEFAADQNITINEWNGIFEKARGLLLQHRNKRVRPATDSKILTSWNALMLKGFVDAYHATGNGQYLQSAIRNARFLETNMMGAEGRLRRNYNDGKAGTNAFLDDYAMLADSYIHLYQATFDLHWLAQARSLADFAIKHFRDPVSGMFYYTADDAESLVVRKMEIADQVMPSSNSVLANVLYRLGTYYQNETYLEMSTTMVSRLEEHFKTPGFFYGGWASLSGLIAYQPFEVVVCGEKASEKNLQLQRYYNPLSIFMGGNKEILPLMENKRVVGKTIIYVCRNKVCRLPVEDIAAAVKQMKLVSE
jgi:uncharacterized protein YyaL (SSP411 family)